MVAIFLRAPLVASVVVCAAAITGTGTYGIAGNCDCPPNAQTITNQADCNDVCLSDSKAQHCFTNSTYTGDDACTYGSGCNYLESTGTVRWCGADATCYPGSPSAPYCACVAGSTCTAGTSSSPAARWLSPAPNQVCARHFGTSGYATINLGGVQTVEAFVQVVNSSENVNGDPYIGTPFVGNTYQIQNIYFPGRTWGVYLKKNGIYVAKDNPMAYSGMGFDPADTLWHHVAVAGTTLYIDGVATGVVLESKLGVQSFVGMGFFPGRGGTGVGSISYRELRLWSTIRTKKEIVANMYTVANNATGLLSYMPWSERDPVIGDYVQVQYGDGSTHWATVTGISASSGATVYTVVADDGVTSDHPLADLQWTPETMDLAVAAQQRGFGWTLNGTTMDCEAALTTTTTTTRMACTASVCPAGYALNPYGGICATGTCGASDVATCCVQTCAAGATSICTNGYAPNPDGGVCSTGTCGSADIRWCCVQTCQGGLAASVWGFGYALKPGATNCATVACGAADLAQCVVRTCLAGGASICTTGYVQKTTGAGNCNSSTCGAADVAACCVQTCQAGSAAICTNGLVPKSGTALNCASAPCGAADVATCCVQTCAAGNASVCTDGYALSQPTAKCLSSTCGAADLARCCVQTCAAASSSLCTNGLVLKPNPGNCASSMCGTVADVATCCLQPCKASTICVADYALKPGAGNCSSQACSFADVDTCCVRTCKAGAMYDGICTGTYALKPSAGNCNSSRCGAADVDTCCVQTCAAGGASVCAAENGYVRKTNGAGNCNSTVCGANAFDRNSCCLQTCAAASATICTNGTVLKPGAGNCASSTCGAADVATCCVQTCAAASASLCTNGLLLKPGALNCSSSTCGAADMATCCYQTCEAASASVCTSGYRLKPGAGNCSGACGAADLSKCCVQTCASGYNSVCDQNGDLPNPNNNTCASSKCGAADRDACCIKSCAGGSDFICLAPMYVKKPNAGNCSSSTCSAADRATCCLQTCAAAYQAICPSGYMLNNVGSPNCASSTCGAADFATCCVQTCAAASDSICTAGYVPKPGADNCGRSVCDANSRYVCCLQTCAAGYRAACTAGYTLKPDAGNCSSSQCGASDRDTCCVQTNGATTTTLAITTTRAITTTLAGVSTSTSTSTRTSTSTLSKTSSLTRTSSSTSSSTTTTISWLLQYNDYSCTSSRPFLFSSYDAQCQQRCASDVKCAAYAVWPMTGWCENYEDCTGPTADPGNNTIYAYTKATTTSTSTSTSTVTGSTVTTSTTTITAPPAVVLAPSPPVCADNTDFRDTLGLGCDDWYSQNCSALTKGYTASDLQSVQDSCPVSCGFCPGVRKPKMVIQQAKQVGFSMQIQVDLSVLPDAVRVAVVKASFAAALNVSVNYIASVTIQQVSDSRRLEAGAGLVPKYNIRCEVVVPFSVQVRSVVLQATMLSTPGSAAYNAFEAGLAAAGVDTSSLNISVTEKPVAVTVNIAVHDDGTISTLHDTSSSASASDSATGGGDGAAAGASAGTAVITAGCEDNPDFVDEQGEGCSGWVGYSCGSAVWLRTERPYTVKGLQDVQGQCPLSCGLCTVPGRPLPADLKASCADDAYIASWCMRWRGMNCSAATSLGYSTGYQQLLLNRCPLSCGTCGGAAPPLVDAPGFKDELGNNCSSWRGSDCTKMYSGYTRKGVLMVQAACQDSCFAGQRRRLAATCQDDSKFSYLQQYKCQDFVGRICTYATLYQNARWLLGPRGALAWHEHIWGHCPVACGLCEPQERPTFSDLFIECQDDLYVSDWCSYKWKGQNCFNWQQSVNLVVPHENERFNATLLGRCPSGCQLCTPPVCQAGTFRDTRRHACVDCPVGTYMPNATSGPDSVRCLAAQRGFAVPHVGAVSEEPCELGTYASRTGQAACDPCEPGRYTGSRGSQDCLQCEAGHFQAANGSSACERCPRGTYAPDPAAVNCTACPPGFSTLLEASVSDLSCSCPPGRWRPSNSSACQDCPPGIFCPGGHGHADDGPDLTAQLLPGMMSLQGDVGSVYTCAALNDTCPGYRPLPHTPELFAEVCPGNQTGPRCAQCPEGFYLKDDGTCADCGMQKTAWGRGLNIVVALFVGIYATQKCYWNCERYRSEGQLMFWILVAFAQGMVPVLKMPIHWPTVFNSTSKVVYPFSLTGMWDLWGFNFQLRCIVGQSFLWETVKNVAIPLLSFVNTGLLFLLTFPIMYLRLDPALALCCIACIWDGCWIALCVMAVMLFPTDTMPNGKEFLRYSPGVELGSEDWKHSLPLGLCAILLYVCVFLAYVLKGVINAPRRMVEDEDFYCKQFGFIVYMYTPEAYWWGLVLYISNFAYALIQAIGSVYWQIYATLFLLVAMILLELWVYPSIFLQLNRINVATKGAHAFFVVLSVCFVDAQTFEANAYTQIVPKVLIALGIVLAVIFLLLLARSLYGGVGRRGWREVVNQRVARKARALMTLVTVMPEQKFIPALKNFFDSDCDKMQEHNKMLTAVFLRMQSGKYWWQSRIIPGARPEVYDKRLVSIKAHELVCRRVMFEAMERNIELHALLDRLQMVILDTDQEELDPAKHPISTAVAASLAQKALRARLTHTRESVKASEVLCPAFSGERIAGALKRLRGSGAAAGEFEGRASAFQRGSQQQVSSLKLMAEVSIELAGFLEEFGGRDGLKDEDLCRLYEAFDHDRTGGVPLARIVAIVLSHHRGFRGTAVESMDEDHNLMYGDDLMDGNDDQGEAQWDFLVEGMEDGHAAEPSSTECRPRWELALGSQDGLVLAYV